MPALITSDEYAVCETVIESIFSEAVDQAAGPGRRPFRHERHPAPGLMYATVPKERENNGVVTVDWNVVLGSQQVAERALEPSTCSRTINTALVKRQHATGRDHNARKARKTYWFSNDWRVHEAIIYFSPYSDNFCWGGGDVAFAWGGWSLAASKPCNSGAGFATHIWSVNEWLTFPAVR
ncbi:hypothetical protein SAMN05444166_5043 [Singulisphaera sp. GP187]|uniref:hypothetical protein n=1 Tax=Singulisphaera sp. GP187 TaxID=1882752 RepID=UPI0009285D6A|nr:hypothetical protein [Singulisphaera sp. GP187]SIO47307.1 hypothetical protein SAMN05444166_5043 [Singulisphaera sp. GP187]